MALIGVLFAIIALGPLITAHRQRPILVGSAVVGLFVMMVLGGFSVGIFIAPGVLLAFVTFILSLAERAGTDATRRSI